MHALTKIYGINKNCSLVICKSLGLSSNLKTKELSKEHMSKLVKLIDSSAYIIADDLKKLKTLTLKRQISIKSYKGLRRKQGLPVRGQRTHTNSKTSRKIR